MAEHDQLVIAIGPYLLGALDASTRRRVRDHLEGCEVCRDELVRLSSVPGLLAQVPQPSVGSEGEPPAALRERLVDSVVAERNQERRRNRRVKAAGAALIIVLPSLVLLIARLTGPNAEAAPLSPMTSTGVVESVHGAAAIEDQEWGSALTVVMDGTSDERLVLFVESPDGRREQAAAWLANGEEVRARGASSFRADEIARVLVTRLNGEELLILEA